MILTLLCGKFKHWKIYQTVGNVYHLQSNRHTDKENTTYPLHHWPTIAVHGKTNHLASDLKFIEFGFIEHQNYSRYSAMTQSFHYTLFTFPLSQATLLQTLTWVNLLYCFFIPPSDILAAFLPSLQDENGISLDTGYEKTCCLTNHFAWVYQ